MYMLLLKLPVLIRSLHTHMGETHQVQWVALYNI